VVKNLESGYKVTMEDYEAFILTLMALVAGVAAVQRYVHLPQPILLLMSGLVIGMIPGLPTIELHPDVVFLVFLPPILYAAASDTSWREFRARLRPIVFLASAGVLVTMVAVAWVAHAIIGSMTWGTAFVLGAIVAPPDAVAATAITRRLGVRRRVVTILEGESLVNDATALVAYRMGVTAVISGTFSLSEGSVEFVLDAVGGVLCGIAMGWVAVWLRRRLENPPVEITLSLLTPFAAYLIADQLLLSGVLSTVSAGLYVGWRVPEISSGTRIQWRAIWDTVIFLLNGIIFLLIGLQMPAILDGVLARHSVEALVSWTILVNAAVILSRFIVIFPAACLQRLLKPDGVGSDPVPSWREVLIIGWSAMRGVVTLAAAMALPLTTMTSDPFPERELIVFLSFSVILTTLVLLGLSLPAVIRRLRVVDEVTVEQEEIMVRLKATAAGLARIEEIAAQEKLPDELLVRLRGDYERHLGFLEALIGKPSGAITGNTAEIETRLRHEALAAARETLLVLRNEGEISYEAVRRIQYLFDLEETSLRRTTAPLSAVGNSGSGAGSHPRGLKPER